jgi:hypothetical protein
LLDCRLTVAVLTRAMEFFGSDSDDDDDDRKDPIAELLAACMRLVPPLAGRRPALCLKNGARRYAKQAAAAGFDVVDGDGDDCDVLLLDIDEDPSAEAEHRANALRNNIIAMHGLGGPDIEGWETVWTGNVQTTASGTRPWDAVYRKLPAVDKVGCPPRPPADAAEACRCARLVVETRRAAGRLPAEAYVDRAARVLRKEGVVILPGLLDAADADALCQDALDDFERCRQELVKKGKGDLAAAQQQHNYRELAMREDLRCDLRGTPSLTSDEGAARRNRLRQNEAIREICRRAATAPASSNREGNYGLWNFDLGGPGAPKKELDAGQLGAVVALPGCAEQALHADAPHVFDGIHLPGHYYNCFLYGGEASNEPKAGQTGFVPGSHFCEACAALVKDAPRNVAAGIVRPRLVSGDALIFDARILHFGLPNRSSKRRAIVYCNHTEYWFRDPKNWDDRVSVFGSD